MLKQLLSPKISFNFEKTVSIITSCFTKLLLFIVSVLALLFPALLNNFPILFYDSGTYLLAGNVPFVPVDRPLLYSLFYSLIGSVWMAVVVQAMLVYFVLFLVTRTLVKSYESFSITFVVVAFLSLLSSLSHYTSQVMPDIYISLSALSLFVILFSTTVNTIQLSSLLILIPLFNGTHFSNIIIYAVLASVLIVISFVIRLFNKSRIKISRYIIGATTVLFSFLITPTVNFFYDEGFVMSNSNYPVTVGSLIEKGVLKDFLNRECGRQNYSLCGRLDSIDNMNDFLWNIKKSPLYDSACVAVNWLGCWKDKNAEYGILVKDVMRDKISRDILLSKFFDNYLFTLFNYRYTVIPSYVQSPSSLYPIKKFYPNELSYYKESPQNLTHFNYTTLNAIQQWTINFSLFIIGLLMLLPVLFRRIRFSGNIYYLLLTVLSLAVINPAVTSAFATYSSRFQGRIVWLFPLVALLLLLNTNLIKPWFNSVKIRQ